MTSAPTQRRKASLVLEMSLPWRGRASRGGLGAWRWCNHPKYLRDVAHEMKASLLTCKSHGGDEQSHEERCHRHLTGHPRLRLHLQVVTCGRKETFNVFFGGTEGSDTLRVQAGGPKDGFSSSSSRMKRTSNATAPYRATVEIPEPHI